MQGKLFDSVAITEAEFTAEVKDDGIYLVDTGHNTHRSVTNDAENVVKRVVNEYPEAAHLRIFYKDSMGRWDELVHLGDDFLGFAAAPHLN